MTSSEIKDKSHIALIVNTCYEAFVRQSFQSKAFPDQNAFRGITKDNMKDATIHEYDIVVEGRPQHWTVVDSNVAKFVVNETDRDYYEIFNKTTGFNARLGKDAETDPTWCPLGPEILDFEISINGCPKVGGASCKFCCPPDTKITLSSGEKKNIQDVVSGDNVLSLSIGKKNHFSKNEVMEVYERDYDGDLIVFELEDGKILKVTPNHPFVLRDGTEVKAEDVTSDMDIVVEDDYVHCQICGKPKILGDKFAERFICSEECQNKNHGKCFICGGKTGTKRKIFCNNCVPKSTLPSTHPLSNIRFVATIRVNGKPIYLGSFKTEEEAAKAYDKALIANGGDKEHCNFKD